MQNLQIVPAVHIHHFQIAILKWKLAVLVWDGQKNKLSQQRNPKEHIFYEGAKTMNYVGIALSCETICIQN